MGHCVHRVTQFQRNKVEPLKTCFIRALNGLAHVFCLHRIAYYRGRISEPRKKYLLSMNLVNMSRTKQNIKKQKVQTIDCTKTMDKKEQKHKEINHRCLNTVNLKNSKRP